MSDYINTFDRLNLVESRVWSKKEADRRVKILIPTLRDREVLVLGTKVRDAFGLPPMLVHPVRMHDAVFRQLPHPSGRCRWYNDEANREIASLLLEELYEKGRENASQEKV